MNMYTNTKKSKKFILILVLLILFSFCYPKNVKAKLVDDIVAAPAKIFWILEEGIIKFLNNLFVNTINETNSMLDIKLTPENIIKGKFILFDANIFREITNDKGYYDYVVGGAVAEGKIILRETISGWYYALRNFAIIALLSVLVYVGIRMIMSTVAQDKAKYKVMFKDWLVALCLVVVMHYMMIAILNICSLVTEALGAGENSNMIGTLTEDITGILNNSKGNEDTANGDPYTHNDMTLGDAYAKIVVMGGIIIYTFIFAVKYLKREFTIIFLILLGPVSCVTYPIDKISDGKAQAFNKWFSEFLYQVIIQPFHLLLYIVLIGSATQLADANVIYAIICFAVMIPAEKFVKEMFGFKDKLGSPLTAFAGGALASKAISALTNKGKSSGGSGGNGDGSDNNSTPNQLPPRTVDREALSGGSGDNDSGSDNNGQSDTDRGTIAQQDNPELESGEEPGGGASAAAAYQNSDDPVADAERAALEEQIADGQIDEEELTDEQRNLLGRGNGDEPDSPENPEKPQNPQNSQEATSENEESSLNSQQSRWDKIKAIHNQRASKKQGSTQRGQRWKRRIGKGLKAGAKGVLKGGAIGMLGAAAITGALLTGNGKEALGIAAGIGAYAGKSAISGGKKLIKGATGAVKDYRNGLRSDDNKEKKALKDFKADKNQIDKAVLSYRENHEGQDPGYKELDQEMNDRFDLSRYGLDDDQIDRSVGSYQELKKNGIPEKDALNQTVYAAKLAKDYSKKDFRSEKTMQEAKDTISKKFQEYGAPKNIADANAEKYLRQAAKIKGTEIALPSSVTSTSTNQTIDIPVAQEPLDMPTLLGIENSNLSDSQIERMNNITVRLQEQGYSDAEISDIARSSADSRVSADQVINKFSVKTEFLENKGQQAHAAKILEATGKEVTPQNIKEEMKDRLVLSETFNVRPQDISHIRKEETRKLSTVSQVKAARDFAIKNKGQLGNSAHMEVEKQKLINQLKQGGSSADKAIKDAENIITLASQYEGTTTKPKTKNKRK